MALKTIKLYINNTILSATNLQYFFKATTEDETFLFTNISKEIAMKSLI